MRTGNPACAASQGTTARGTGVWVPNLDVPKLEPEPGRNDAGQDAFGQREAFEGSAKEPLTRWVGRDAFSAKA